MSEYINDKNAIRHMLEGMSAEAKIEMALEMFPAGEACLDLQGQVVIYTAHYENPDCNEIKFTDEDGDFSGSHYKGQF